MTRFLQNLALPLATLAALANGGLSGCAGKSIDENDPAALIKEAEDDISSDHFQIAIDKLRIVKNKFPYSKEAIDAQLRIADVYYMQEAFAEAALAYEGFRDLHPKHEKVPYAMFRVGKSYQSDMPGTIARDMSSAQRALDAYQEYLKRFSASAEADEARKSVADIRRNLAQKEMYVGEFYLRNDDYDAARGRFSKVVKEFPDTQEASKAKEKLAGLGNKTSKSSSQEKK